MIFMMGSIAASVLAALVIIGGIIGFVKARSMMSLVAGVVSAILLFVCAWLMTSANAMAGLIGAFVVSAMLEGIFVIRLKKTKKFMPSGMMLIASLLAQVVFIYEFAVTSGKCF